ncbi:hypothetical protein [Pseudarthrobacter sp. PS3-L1]|uniref:hypothetical protein n=1 Tax=Pseudarthrobacter sp. PS3-L1 TaxID=3046207 RepID=UPI0024BA02AD|nr:hypothetical protein [Pseudarthrobacter sp. PS3-L1]MDJ0319516.1 hypothetical protein [Pseudarthrobacter sp. PS3-L1]
MQDLKRFSIKPIIVNHFRSLRADGQKRISAGTLATLFVLPLAVAGLGLSFHFKLDRGGATALLTATGLLVGALVTAFIFLANLRIKISESNEFSIRRRMSVLTSQTAVACLYCAGLALSIAVSLAVALAVPRAARPEWAHLAATFVIVAGLVHLAVNFLTVLRRLFGVYYDVFRADFVRLAPAEDPDAPNLSSHPVATDQAESPTRRVQMK